MFFKPSSGTDALLNRVKLAGPASPVLIHRPPCVTLGMKSFLFHSLLGSGIFLWSSVAELGALESDKPVDASWLEAMCTVFTLCGMQVGHVVISYCHRCKPCLTLFLTPCKGAMTEAIRFGNYFIVSCTKWCQISTHHGPWSQKNESIVLKDKCAPVKKCLLLKDKYNHFYLHGIKRI